MAKLNIRVWCQAFYDTSIEIPNKNMSIEDAFEYAKDHINEAPITTLNYLEDSDELDDEDLYNETHTYITE